PHQPHPPGLEGDVPLPVPVRVGDDCHRDRSLRRPLSGHRPPRRPAPTVRRASAPGDRPAPGWEGSRRDEEGGMNRNRRSRVVAGAALAAMSFFAGPLPAAVAQFFPGAGGLGGPCGDTQGGDGQGAVGGNTYEVCQGSGSVMIGPAIGQIATVRGPVVTGTANVGAVNVSAGNVAGNAGSSSLP